MIKNFNKIYIYVSEECELIVGSSKKPKRKQHFTLQQGVFIYT